MHSQSYHVTKSGCLHTSINKELVPIKAGAILGDVKILIIQIPIFARKNYGDACMFIPLYIPLGVSLKECKLKLRKFPVFSQSCNITLTFMKPEIPEMHMKLMLFL